jgi:cytochrome c oxidase cbb3-type subunit 3
LWLAVAAALALTLRAAPAHSRVPSPESRFPNAGSRVPGPDDRVPAPLANPDSAAGATLFVSYNCADCHGVDGAGAMGPSLADNRWRFGGSADEVYRSIADGRPEGMPRWGPKIPPAHIRQLTAYVRSLGAGRDVTTEDFRGRTVTTVGH